MGTQGKWETRSISAPAAAGLHLVRTGKCQTLLVRGCGDWSVPPLGAARGIAMYTSSQIRGSTFLEERGSSEKQAGVGSAMVTPWEGLLCLPFALQMCPAVGDCYRWEQGSMAWQAESSSVPQGEGQLWLTCSALFCSHTPNCS